jgi:hypothetical protein
MIRPVHFTYNEQTAVNNAFQNAGQHHDAQTKALQEFDDFVTLLRGNGIDVTVVNDTPQPHTPDSIFPNNWVSFHSDGTICLYPMFAVNRRLERKQHVLDAIGQKFSIQATVDLTAYEAQNLFLEGTGSMVLDRDNKIAYACLSPRTNKAAFYDFCDRFLYTPVAFGAVDSHGQDIYHTNVMMCVGDTYTVICLDSIANAKEREHVTDTILATQKEIIAITLQQMNHFAGNMLQVQNSSGQKFLIMSTQAYESLSTQQISLLQQHNPILHSSLHTIETNGGGSARCMMAEVFLPAKTTI